jgi:hypothetical protein
VSTNVVEGGFATFFVDYDNVGLTQIQWRRNGVNIPGQTGKSLGIGPVTLADNGARYRAFLTNALGTALSSEAILTVTADTVAPRFVRAFNDSPNTITLEFSEAVNLPTGSLTTAFQITPALDVSSATTGDVPNRLRLTVPVLVSGTRYTVRVTGVTDRAAAANPVTPGSTASFVASELAPASLGSDGVAGSVLRGGPGEFDVSATGGDINGTSDTAAFAWQTLNGNFDLRVRVADFALTDPYAVAGLMARVGRTANGIFAGTFASSSRPGVLFESRNTAGGEATYGSIRGGFPINHPHTWLRLRRVGNELAGFGSLDGVRWTQLGTMTASLPAQLSVGLGVAGRDASRTATARFREYGPTTSTTVGTHTPTREGLGVTSRRTRIVVSEIHYDTATAGAGSASEFIELFNAGDIFEDLSGWTIRGGATFQFPAGFRLGAGEFVVVAADPTALRAAGASGQVLGPFTGTLSNNGDVLELRDELGAQKLLVEFDNNAPWPVAAAGTGHSLVLINPSYGENDPRAYGASAFRGGNPGNIDPIVADPADGVVLNELLAHTDLPLLDFIELHNSNRVGINLSGCVLTDDFSSLGSA